MVYNFSVLINIERGIIMIWVLVYIIVGLVIFFLIREVWCWYYKTNEILEKLDEINRKLDNK